MKNYPLIKYVIAFAFGIVLGKYFFVPIDVFIIGNIFLLLIAIFLKFKNLNKPLSAVLLLMILLFGNFYSHLKNEKTATYPFAENRISNAIVYGRITDINLIRNNKIKLVVQSDSIITKDSVLFLRNNFLCSVEKSKSKKIRRLYNRLGIGNKVGLKGTIRKGREQRNPGEFDYHKYLQSKNISGLVYVKNTKNFRILEKETNLFKNAIFKIRKNIAEKIDRLHNNRTAALLKGLLLADRSDIGYVLK